MSDMDKTIDADINKHNVIAKGDEINLLEYLLVIVKYKKMIFYSCGIAFVLSCLVSLLLPNIYTATTMILPPQQEKGGLGTMLGGVGDLAALAGVSLGRHSGELYIAMLKSRTMSDAVIDRFNLMERYEWKFRSNAYKALKKKVNVSLEEKGGLITISVEDKNPQMAADIAKSYVEELKNLNIKINLSSAGRQRQFLEKRLAVVKNDLTQAEERLKVFQEQNKAIRIDDQATAIIEAIAQLKGELAGKEVELGVLLSSHTEKNPQVMALHEAISQIKGQIHKLERSSSGKNGSEDIFITTSDVPEMGVQYARLLREFKVQETIYELLTKQYEVAKIEEAKNTSTIEIIDPAVVPDRKSKPKRSMIVVFMTFAVGFVAVIVAFIKEYGSRMEEKDRRLWAEIRHMLRSKN